MIGDNVDFTQRQITINQQQLTISMFQITIENDFADWRLKARKLLESGVQPSNVLFTNGEQNGLFADFDLPIGKELSKFTVPADFLATAETVALVDDSDKWNLLYRILWRVVHENRNLLDIESDDDVRAALLHVKAIRRDVHKFHAFVRFRKIENVEPETFVAWHEPAHFTVKRAAPFFARRFGAMRFSILTPKLCAHWDLENLIFTDGVTADDAPQADETEAFWKTYYASIFNPARLKVKAMKAEMPVKFWRNLPEAALIPDLIRGAETRTREMLENKAKRHVVIEKLSEKSNS